MPAQPFFHRESHGIRVTVRPRFVPAQSLPEAGRFVFAYFVRIENVSAQTVQLLSRRWLIHDALGDDLEVVGEGVVGQQPTLPPGTVHEYSSFCVLGAATGYMEGHYTFVRADGSAFDAQIPRFELAAGV